MRGRAAAVALLVAAAPARAQDAGPPDAAPRAVDIDFEAEGGPVEVVAPRDPNPVHFDSVLPDRFARAPEPDPPPPPPGRGPWPWLALSAGGAGLIGGATFHVLAVRAGDDADALPPGPERDDRASAFEVRRAAAIGLYLAGAVTAGVGVYLLVRRPAAPAVGLAPAAGGDGALLWLGWRR